MNERMHINVSVPPVLYRSIYLNKNVEMQHLRQVHQRKRLKNTVKIERTGSRPVSDSMTTALTTSGC